MSSPTPTIGGPPLGEIVSNKVQESLVLSGRSFGVLRLAQAFAGQTDPTVVWQSMIGDRQDAFQFMRELEEKDEDIGTHIEQLKLAVCNRPITITPGDETAGAKEVADFVGAALKLIPNMNGVIYQMLDAAPYGVSIAEIIWGFADVLKRPNSIIVADIKDRPQELFTFNPSRLPQIGNLRFLRSVYDVSGGEEVPEEKFVVFSHRMRSGVRRGRPLLRSVFWPSWFKRQTLRMWLRFAEKGPGTAVVKYTAGNSDEATKALAAAEDIVEKIAVAVPENFEIVTELLNSARATSPDTYAKLVERMELSIARRIVGQTQTTRAGEGGKGTQALGRVHQDMFNMIAKALACEVEAIFNDKIVKPIVMFNYGPQVPMPHWCISFDEGEDLTQTITVDDKLQQMGLEYSESYLREKYGVPKPTGPEDVLSRPAPASPFGGPTDPNNPDQPPKNPNDMGENPKTLTDVKKMIAQMKEQSFDVFKARILALTEEARQHIALGGK